MTQKNQGLMLLTILFGKITKAYKMTSLLELIKTKSKFDTKVSDPDLVPS